MFYLYHWQEDLLNLNCSLLHRSRRSLIRLRLQISLSSHMLFKGLHTHLRQVIAPGTSSAPSWKKPKKKKKRHQHRGKKLSWADN
jgi:hypothetical protein